MRITDIKTYMVKVPIRDIYLTAYGVESKLRETVLVEVLTDEGIVGFGEAAVEPLFPVGGEGLESVVFTIKNYLSKAVVGEDPVNIELIHRKMDRMISGNLYAKAGIDIALFDIIGKYFDIPVYTLLGGWVREGVPVKYDIPIIEPEKAARIAENAMKKGFKALKVKVGLDLKKELEVLEAVRNAVGWEVVIGVDANAAWSPMEAVSAVKKLERYDLAFIEQPVKGWDFQGMATVRRAISTPVMADESLVTLHDAYKLLRDGAADILSIYVTKVGGLLRSKKVADVAEAAGASCTIGSDMEQGVGSASMLHLALTLPNLGIPIDLPSPYYSESLLIKESIEIKDGVAHPPEGPGLGVTLDKAEVEKYSIPII